MRWYETRHRGSLKPLKASPGWGSDRYLGLGRLLRPGIIGWYHARFGVRLDLGDDRRDGGIGHLCRRISFL